MDDILFQLDLIWSIFLQYMSKMNECKEDKEILVRLWSVQYYWKNVLNASFEIGEINECDFFKDDMKTCIDDIVFIHNQWIMCMSQLSKEELHSIKLCRWPFDNRSFFSLALWVNIEFMKYVSEIGLLHEKNSG